MDDPGAEFAVDAGKIVAAMIHQRVDQSAGIIAGRRVDDHALRLIDDEKMVVLIDDIEGDVLGSDIDGTRRVDDHADSVSGSQSGAFLRGSIPYRDLAVLDQLGDRGAAEVVDAIAEVFIQTDAGIGRIDGEIEAAHIRIPQRGRDHPTALLFSCRS